MINKNCCGCSACSIICPKDAIEMKINSDGFYRPIIRTDKCINCGLCKKVCQYTSNIKDKELGKYGFYSAYSLDDNIRKTTSSGGISFEVLRQSLKRMYAVTGVIYDSNTNVAKHIIVNDFKSEELEMIKGSKYIQSKNEEAFKDILDYDKAIIIGTPCQIAGMRQILNLKRLASKDFVLIDIFCHGVPSYNLWFRYLENISKNFGIDLNSKLNVIFRNKEKGWHEYNIKITDGKHTYEMVRNKDYFYKMFLNEYCNSDSCYNCKFRNSTCSDIRLGDYWGKRYQNDEKGYSMVCINTEKGKLFFDSLENIRADKMDINERLVQRTEQYNFPPNYDKIISDLKSNKFKFYKYIYKINLLYFKLNIKKIIKKIIKS